MTKSCSSDGLRGRSSTEEPLIPNQEAPGQHRSTAPNIGSILQEAFLNPETSIVCIDCGVTYTMPDQEYDRFKALMATNPTFKMPRRCADCRRARRNQVPPTLKAQVPSYTSGLAQYPHADVAPIAHREEASKDEILFVLATKDFEDLVNGRPVVWRGVRVVLADIGLKVMKKAIEDVELEKAKKIVKENGH